MGRKSLQSERRAQILDVCERIVGAEGLAALTPARVGRELGLDRSTIHHYFRTQADLTAGLVERMIDGYLARAPKPDGSPPSTETIRKRLDELMGEGFLIPRYDRVIAEFAAAAFRDDRVRRQLERLYRELEAACISMLRKEFPSVDPERVRESGMAVNALVEGAYQVRANGGSQASLDAARRAALHILEDLERAQRSATSTATEE